MRQARCASKTTVPPRARATGPAGLVTWPLPEVKAPVPRLARSRLRCLMSRLPRPVVTRPGPGGPVTFSSASYVTYHVTVNMICHVIID